MDGRPVVAGYEVEQMLGFGATGEVWRARELASGETVALKRLRTGADPAALQREAEALSALSTPHVVRLRAAVDGVLVLDHAGGGSLAALLTRRGVLDPGEVVTVAVPLAEALAEAHALGLVHGDLSPRNVLFADDGMPLLSDLGAARREGDRRPVVATAEYVDPVVARGAVPGPASDVWALGALCAHLLCGSPPHEGASVDDVLGAAARGERAPLGLLAPHVPRALVAVVEAALCGDPAARPTAAALASALLAAHAPEPVRLHDGRTPPRDAPVLRETTGVAQLDAVPDPGAPRRPRWPVVAAGLVAGLLLVAGLVWALHPPAPVAGRLPLAVPPPVAAPPPVRDRPVDWAAVLAELDTRREEAFARADPTLLDAVYAPGAAPREADAAVLRALGAAGRTATGVRHDVLEVRPGAATAERVELLVTDRLAPATVLGPGGALVERRPGRGPSSYEVVLVPGAEQWRIAELTPT